VPKDGGALRVVAESPEFVSNIRANDDYVYWTVDEGGPTDGVYRAPAAGGATELVFRGYHFSELALDDRNVYFAHFPGNGSKAASVYAVPVSGGAPVLLQDGINIWGWQSGLAIDDTDVYFVDDAPPRKLDGTDQRMYIKRVPKTGGPATAVLTCIDETACSGFTVRVDARNFYYRDRMGAIHSHSKAGGTAVVIGAVPNQMTGTDFDVSDGVVYWSNDTWNPRWNPQPSPPAGILRANGDATAAEYVDAAATSFGTLRADYQYLYYFRGTDLVRHRK